MSAEPYAQRGGRVGRLLPLGVRQAYPFGRAHLARYMSFALVTGQKRAPDGRPWTSRRPGLVQLTG
jgi:hypothetical protein